MPPHQPPAAPESSAAPDSAIDLLREMIRFDTVTPRDSGRPDAEHALACWLQTLCEQWGFKTEWLPVDGFSPNLLVTCETAADAPWWLFDSHLDTVGVEGMTVDPFGAELRDGRVLGRGACDTKGTGAAMLTALRRVRDAGELGANTALLFTVCEEDHQQGALAFARETLPTLGWRPAGVVVGEPTRMRAIGASNGFARWRLHTLGTAAHSSTPALGHNAIVDMAAAVGWLDQQHAAPINAGGQPHPLTGGGSCSINLIAGGTQLNVVPERCTITIDQRVPPGVDPMSAVEAVTHQLHALAKTRPGLRWEASHVETAPPFASEASLHLAERIDGLLGGPGVAGAPYTTNANHYAAHGLPCVILGPGDIALAHTRDESIGVAELEAGVDGYAKLMRQKP